MKRDIFLLLGLIFILSSCSSKQIIFNNPGFTHSKWESKKIGVLPVLILPTSYSEMKEEVINKKAEEVISKRKLRFAELISPLIIHKEMISNKIMGNYNEITDSYKKLDSWQKRKDFVLKPEDIKKISGILGLDRLVVLKIIRMISSGDEDSDGREKTKYLCLTQMQIYDSKAGTMIYKYTTYGEHLYVEHSSKLLSILTSPIHINFDYTGKYYNRAFENGFHRVLIKLDDNFIGECVTGDCINGRGEFIMYHSKYDRKGVTDQKYNGSWLNSFAHGNGTFYYSRNGIHVKYDGVWEKGELVKKKDIYYLKDGQWIKTSNSELNNILIK